MEIKKIVADYATKKGSTVEVDLEALVADGEFRSEMIKKVKAYVKGKPQACVLLPSYKRAVENPLGKFINELAMQLQTETLVTGKTENIQRLIVKPTDVIVIKKSFRAGKELKEQIAELKGMGVNIYVLCFVAHSGAKLQGFAVENGVDMEAVVKTDEIPYL